jgi:hemerythrin-like domain-containing protein
MGTSYLVARQFDDRDPTTTHSEDVSVNPRCGEPLRRAKQPRYSAPEFQRHRGQRTERRMVTQNSSQADTRLYVVVHKAFRLATTRLVDASETLDPSQLQSIFGPRWRFYSDVLHQHHHTEDDKIFPALVAVRPDMGALIEKLEDDHQQLVRTIEAVDSAVSAIERTPDTAHQKALHESLVAVRDAFFPHLDIEDEKILPAIAESIPPKQWDQMDKDALKSIPRKHLPIAVASLDEVVQGMPRVEQPPPPPLPIRLMLALSWRKKFSAWVKPLLG